MFRSLVLKILPLSVIITNSSLRTPRLYFLVKIWRTFHERQHLTRVRLIILADFCGFTLCYSSDSQQLPMSPHKNESDMKALVSIRIVDNVADVEASHTLIFVNDN